MSELISIIVPIYNSEKYLDNCVTSILNQSFTDIELILIDDGSTDNSGMICDKYTKQDSRVIVKHILNGGVSNARNLGINIAVGKYIAFIDSDDFIEENYFMELYKSLIINGSQMALCPIKIIDDERSRGLRVRSGVICFDNIDKQLFLNLNKEFLLYGPTNKLYLHDIIKKNNLRFDTKISYGEDLTFNFNYYRLINKISITNSVYYCYLQGNGQSLSKRYYENKFLIAKSIHQTLLSFFNYLNLTDAESYQLLYGRLFDDFYNSLFLINHQNFPKGFINKYKYVKCILNDNELNICIKYADTSTYSKKIVSIIKLRNVILFLIFNHFARLKH